MASAARCAGVRRSHSASLTPAAKKSSQGTMTASMARATASATVLLPEPLRPSMATTRRWALPSRHVSRRPRCRRPGSAWLVCGCSLGSGEVGILNQAHQVAKRIGDRCHTNVATDVLHGRLETRAGASELPDRGVDVWYAPVGHRSTRARTYPRRVRIQPQLVAANVEADVERLVEVGLNAEDRAVPRRGAFQVGYMIDDGT